MEVLQDTYKDTKIGRIPKDWEVTQLASICDIIMGQSPSSESYNEDSIGLPLVQGNADIKSRITKPRIYTSQITKISEIGDVIMTVRAPVGAIAKSNIKCCIGRGVCALRVKFINDEFLYQLLIKKEASWVRLEQGSTFTAVNSKDIKTFKIPVPPLPEQQKIADILSTVDEQISTTDKIIEKSKELKKGLMQKLFSEGIGHTEFKDTKIGRVPKNWEVNLFGNFVEIKSGFGFKKDDYSENGFRLLRIDNVTYGKIIWNNIAHIPFSFEEKHKDLVLSLGDILLALNRPITKNQLKIGRITKNDLPSILYQRVGKLSSSSQELRDDFLYYLSKYFIYFFVQKSSVGSDQPFINLTSLRKMKVPIPSLTEQQKIAAILSEADAKIEKEQTQKAQLQALKKGLMQQLLTGKKRVKV